MIYKEIQELLIRFGWKIDAEAKPNKSLELKEFIHPFSGKRYAWLDAILEAEALEDINYMSQCLMENGYE